MDVEASSPPFGMSPALPAFHRATRIAEALFDGAEACVVLVDGDSVWRCGGSLVGADIRPTGVLYVMDQKRQGWLADLEADPVQFALIDNTRPYARFWAGAPVSLPDGTTIGVLTVMSQAPRPYDKTLAARLQNLADGVADECERARAAETAAQGERQLRKAREVMSAFVGSAPIKSVMTDNDLRVLTATPRWLEAFGLTEAQAVGRTLQEISGEAFAYGAQRCARSLEDRSRPA